MKYEFTGATKPLLTGGEVRRIRALTDIRPDVPAGTLGGWIEHPGNLDEHGPAWVADDAVVCGHARVQDIALVGGSSAIFGHAMIGGAARVQGHARVTEHATVSGSATVTDNARVQGHARVTEHATVSGSATVTDNARVEDYAHTGDACVSGAARVRGSAVVSGNAQVRGVNITALRSDGYTFSILPQHDGSPLRIAAGCRDFTVQEARAHWQRTRGASRLGQESQAIIDHLVRMAAIAGWDGAAQ